MPIVSIFRSKVYQQFFEALQKFLAVYVVLQALVSSCFYDMVKYGDVDTFLVNFVQVAERHKEKKTAMGRKPAGGHTQPTAVPTMGSHSRHNRKYLEFFFVQVKC